MRIIAGSLKGRRLNTPKWEGVRPTSDKLRETLFNVVAQRVPDARVLDAYAGTGAVGIEALSRGAAHVTFVDNDPRSLKLIEENLQRCGVSDRYAIIRGRLGDTRSPSTPSLFTALTAPFDLAVLDPPYDEPELPAAIAAVEALLAPGGLLVLEHARRHPSPDAGDSALAFYSRRPTHD
jgi:16S rRNA (guanine966-N2)-methyltransferase